MSSQCVFADFADRRKGKGDGAGEILHQLSADDDVGADPNPIGGWQAVQCESLRLTRVRGVPLAGTHGSLLFSPSAGTERPNLDSLGGAGRIAAAPSAAKIGHTGLDVVEPVSIDGHPFDMCLLDTET